MCVVVRAGAGKLPGGLRQAGSRAVIPALDPLSTRALGARGSMLLCVVAGVDLGTATAIASRYSAAVAGVDLAQASRERGEQVVVGGDRLDDLGRDEAGLEQAGERT